MLESMQCTSCQKGEASFTSTEIAEYLSQLENWQIVAQDGIDVLYKEYRFSNFKKAWRFTDDIAALAEQHGHHPEITLSWGKVTVKWWTHTVLGLHINDFICAKQTDLVAVDEKSNG